MHPEQNGTHPEPHNGMHPDAGTSPEGVSDTLAPPAEPIRVYCIECGRDYMSSEMRFEPRDDGPLHSAGRGFWRCATPGCGGAGFGMDIFPYDGSTGPDGGVGGEWGGWFDDDGNPCPPPWLCDEED